jgi:type III pantothenate kinase
MIVLVDIGNSNIVLAQYTNQIDKVTRYNTNREKAINEYIRLFHDFIEGATEIVVSSVVPELNKVFRAIQEELNIPVLFVGPGIKTGVKIKIDNPKELGTDIVCDALGAYSNYHETVIVVDMGTATTITLSKNKTVLGVSICAGLITQKTALIGKASQLAQFEFTHPQKAIGTNTIDSLNNGLLLGHSYMIQGIINQIRKEQGQEIPVVVTGGASIFMRNILPMDYIFEPNLLIKGLIEIYHKNSKQA